MLQTQSCAEQALWCWSEVAGEGEKLSIEVLGLLQLAGQWSPVAYPGRGPLESDKAFL